MNELDTRRAAIINEMAGVHEKIGYNTFLTNLGKRPEDAKAYVKRLSDMALVATGKIDSAPVTGEDLVARIADVKAVRAIVRNLLSDLQNAEANIVALQAQYHGLQVALKALEKPKQSVKTNFRPPK